MKKWLLVWQEVGRWVTVLLGPRPLLKAHVYVCALSIYTFSMHFLPDQYPRHNYLVRMRNKGRVVGLSVSQSVRPSGLSSEGLVEGLVQDKYQNSENTSVYITHRHLRGWKKLRECRQLANYTTWPHPVSNITDSACVLYYKSVGPS